MTDCGSELQKGIERARRLAALAIASILLLIGVLTSTRATTPGDGGLVRVSKHGIALTATGAITLFTTESNSGRRFHPMWIIVEVTDADAITVAATCSFGTNDPDYNNVLAAAALTGLTALNRESKQALSAATDSVAPSTDVKVNVTVAAVATTCTARIDAVGYYE